MLSFQFFYGNPSCIEMNKNTSLCPSYLSVPNSLSYTSVAHSLPYRIITHFLSCRSVIHSLSFSNNIFTKNELRKVFWTVFVGFMIYIVLFIIQVRFTCSRYVSCSLLYICNRTFGPRYGRKLLLIIGSYCVTEKYWTLDVDMNIYMKWAYVIRTVDNNFSSIILNFFTFWSSQQQIIIICCWQFHIRYQRTWLPE